MRLTFALALALGSALAAGTAGFAVDRRAGFYEGYLLALHTSEMTVGAKAVHLLRRGDPEVTRTMLEATSTPRS